MHSDGPFLHLFASWRVRNWTFDRICARKSFRFINTSTSIPLAIIITLLVLGAMDMDFIPTKEFQPVIPLPPLVEVETEAGARNLIFEALVQLYRFDVGAMQWKKRGIGKIQIAKRTVQLIERTEIRMLRECAMKSACSHLITKDMKIKNFDRFGEGARQLTWAALDFSEAESWRPGLSVSKEDGKYEKFACRFGVGKEKECKEFKKHFQDEVDRLKQEHEHEHGGQGAAVAVAHAVGASSMPQAHSSGDKITPAWKPIIEVIEID